jgi:hypothetical protein
MDTTITSSSTPNNSNNSCIITNSSITSNNNINNSPLRVGMSSLRQQPPHISLVKVPYPRSIPSRPASHCTPPPPDHCILATTSPWLHQTYPITLVAAKERVVAMAVAMY